jgi:phosphatidylglycerophosphate synthase
LQTRSKKWAQALAAWMARTGFSPNGVSLLGLAIAALGAGAMLKGWWWAAAVCVQLRLLCNMLDGLIAVEHGKGDKLGGFFNEVPDRAEDVMLLLAAGFAAGGQWGPTLGWAASLLAVLTAYLRQAGGAMGLPQDFCGPLAKPQRMFVLTVTLLAAGGVALARVANPADVLAGGLVVIAAGTAITVVRRTARLMEALKRR